MCAWGEHPIFSPRVLCLAQAMKELLIPGWSGSSEVQPPQLNPHPVRIPIDWIEDAGIALCIQLGCVLPGTKGCDFKRKPNCRPAHGRQSALANGTRAVFIASARRLTA